MYLRGVRVVGRSVGKARRLINPGGKGVGKAGRRERGREAGEWGPATGRASSRQDAKDVAYR